MDKPLPRLRLQAAFTLMEVLVAITIMAIIATLAGQALHTASVSGETTDAAVKRLAAVDRALVLMEADLRNALPRAIKPPSDEAIPALTVGSSGDYWMTVLRGGVANPLHLTRSELVRVGYRLQDGVLWRDTWIDIASTDERDALKQKLLPELKDVVVRVLSESASSIAAGPWVTDWPATGVGSEKLPRAIEVTLQLEDMGEIRRLFPLLPGEDVIFVNNGPQPGASSGSGSSSGGDRPNNDGSSSGGNGGNQFGDEGSGGNFDPSQGGE
jgi:general secretion pathway protein J